ncbi:MAG: zinc ribbon domain-containing protein [Bacteroidales bacterium]
MAEFQQKRKELHKEGILKQREALRASSDGATCPYCGKDIRKSWEFCPGCGHSLVGWCTFCGADIPRGEDECPECGMSRSGIVCPKCGTLNVRGFCSKCNEPLTMAAKKELERARKDPAFLKAAELAVKAAEIQTMIEAAEEEVAKENIEAKLPEDVMRLRELLGKTTFRQAQEPEKVRQEQRSGAPAGPAAGKMKSKAELRAEYSRIQEELNKALSEMLPPAGSTPQEQRNYFSARKLPVEKIIHTKVRNAWVCNFCGCWHNRPSECCEPWHGGKWVCEYKEEKILGFV